MSFPLPIPDFSFVPPPGIKTDIWLKIFRAGELGEKWIIQVYDLGNTNEHPLFQFVTDQGSLINVIRTEPNVAWTFAGGTWADYVAFRETGESPFDME